MHAADIFRALRGAKRGCPHRPQGAKRVCPGQKCAPRLTFSRRTRITCNNKGNGGILSVCTYVHVKEGRKEGKLRRKTHTLLTPRHKCTVYGDDRDMRPCLSVNNEPITQPGRRCMHADRLQYVTDPCTDTRPGSPDKIREDCWVSRRYAPDGPNHPSFRGNRTMVVGAPWKSSVGFCEVTRRYRLL